LLINVITTNKIDNFLLKTSKEHKAFEIQLTNEINEELEFIKEILCECNLSYFSNIVCKRINYNEKYDFDDRELSDYYDFYMILQQIINLKYNLKKNPSSSLIISDIITTISSIIDDYDKNQNMRLKTTLSLYYKIIFKLMENRVYHALLEDFDKQLKKIENSKNDNLGENINTLSKLINTRIKERKDNIRKISKLFLKELEKVNNHNLNIILFGYSSTIIDCIDYIKQDDDFKITFYICEVRSKTQYGANNKLEFCDGLLNIEKISNITKDSSWKIFYLPDSGISNLLDRLEKNEKDSSSIVLLGVNAIDADYNVTHTMGALTVAEIASDKNIPIWIIAESSKMVIKFKDRSDRKREQKWLATDVHSLKILQNKESYNYREDTINSKYISLFITEKGVQSLHK
jgi:translation initiation factor 2B subunit (eIF-2B alpha/beta/delta family)